ncbi:MAG TPA: fructosamine kinase family protein [Chitinophagaceae bacterium]
MIPQQVKELLKTRLSQRSGKTVSSFECRSVGGGSINSTYQVTTDAGKKFFLKLNDETAFPRLFEKERNGLGFIDRQNCILTPPVVFYETNGNYQLLLLEWIEGGIRNESFWKKFGEQLAKLHSVTQEHFGFLEDNYMGSLPQINTFTNDWSEFFNNYRLRPQMELALTKGLLDKSHIVAFETLFKRSASIFNPGKPSLLHGDLWSGNLMCNEQSSPVLIDPAVYFGHRSMDLAMTTLFGGFDKSFYDAYHYHLPLPVNYEEQWELCNLYPLLIHLNLFGKSYLPAILNTLRNFT